MSEEPRQQIVITLTMYSPIGGQFIDHLRGKLAELYSTGGSTFSVKNIDLRLDGR